MTSRRIKERLQRMIPLLLLVAIMGLTWLLVRDRLLSAFHVTTVEIDRPYEEVWDYVSDPLKFPQLYPKWVSRIEPTSKNTFLVTSPHVKAPYEISVDADEAAGAIDIQIGQEMSRTRLIRLNELSTAIIHVGTKWKDFNWFLWIIYKFNVDSDFRNAKSILEAERGRESFLEKDSRPL